MGFDPDMYRVNSVLSNLLIKAMAKEFKNEKNLKRISKFLLDFADALMVSGTQTSRYFSSQNIAQ